MYKAEMPRDVVGRCKLNAVDPKLESDDWFQTLAPLNVNPGLKKCALQNATTCATYNAVAEAFAKVYGAGSRDTAMALTAFCGDACATLAAHPLLEELSDKYHEPRSMQW